jgi:hypothetical protein
VLTEAARVRVTVARNGIVVRAVDYHGTPGTNRRVIRATRTLSAGTYTVGVQARNARGTTRIVRVAFRLR